MSPDEAAYVVDGIKSAVTDLRTRKKATTA